jgi:hypothetical protein
MGVFQPVHPGFVGNEVSLIVLNLLLFFCSSLLSNKEKRRRQGRDLRQSPKS